MKKTLLFLIVFVVFSSAYAEGCRCTDRHAFIWGRDRLYYGGDTSDFKHYITYTTKAEDLIEKGKYWEAIDFYRKALIIEDCLPEPYDGIAYCYIKLQYKHQALEYYKKACDRADCDSMSKSLGYCTKYKDLRMELYGY